MHCRTMVSADRMLKTRLGQTKMRSRTKKAHLFLRKKPIFAPTHLQMPTRSFTLGSRGLQIGPEEEG
jgi:hypothetical protein